jgi:23S rRNA pseudouridine1911/1915/1917 synthase
LNPKESSTQRRFHDLPEIVAESEDWLVADKPAGMEAHPSKPNGRRTLWHVLREILAYEIINGGQVSIINRLDRETSGLTLIAKSHAAARQFHGLMERRVITKEYLAVVRGWPTEDEFSADLPLLRQGTREPSAIYLKQMAHPEGAPSHTHFKVERRFLKPGAGSGAFSLIRCFPRTGRMHQIRVHLAALGHPIVGDKIYGPEEGCYLEFIQTGWTGSLNARLLLPRHALHSCAMSIPELGLSWRSPLPEDLRLWMDPEICSRPSNPAT